MSLFNPTRDQVRTFFIDAWRKEREGLPQTPLEMQASTFVKWHPEYHALLEAPDALTREWTPADGETNPFLHLSMHLAIYEQLQIDQPPGLREAFTKLCDKHGNQHDAFHDVLDCLGETMWKAQREGLPPDSAAYVECVRMKL